MHLILSLIALLSLFLGAFITLSIAAFGRKFGDRGSASLVFPMTAMFILTLTEFLRLPGELLIAPSAIRPTVLLIEDASRIVLSFAWVYVCHRHNVLNEVLDFRRKLTPAFAAVGALSLALLTASRLLELPFPSETLINIQVASFLFYAAVSGLVMLWRKPILLPSSRAILAVAGISIVVYPMVSLADIFGFSYPGMDPGVPVWMQTEPVYFLIVCVPLFYYVLHKLIVSGVVGAADGEGAMSKLGLTVRERAIISLLVRGESYKGIAHELGISLATVKTHVNRAYAKLGVQSRAQLQAFLVKR
jgi:DNA-binding CsgD family transcriptional regulator